MRVTIYDVAKRAGVGLGTVSRVINNSSQISPKTREKVLQVIEELRYRPSAMAQGLARRCTNTIACIVPMFTGYFYFELLNGVQRALSNHGYDLLLYSVDHFERKEEFFKRALTERRVDGVLVISMTISDKYSKRFIQSKLPIVLVDSFHENLDSVATENKEGAFVATQHLIDLGHKKIAMINGSLNSTPARHRLEGFGEALKQNNITLDKRCIFNVCPQDDAEMNYNDGFNKVSGYRAMRELLQLKPPRPTAAFISSDIQAVGAIKALQENRLKIPDDIALVSFDGIELSEYINLTTMKQPMYEMGKIAVEQLIKKVRNPSTNGAFKKLFHPQLIIRDTCGARFKQ